MKPVKFMLHQQHPIRLLMKTLQLSKHLEGLISLAVFAHSLTLQALPLARCAQVRSETMRVLKIEVKTR